MIRPTSLVPGMFWETVRRRFFDDDEREPRPAIPIVARTGRRCGAVSLHGLHGVAGCRPPRRAWPSAPTGTGSPWGVVSGAIAHRAVGEEGEALADPGLEGGETQSAPRLF